MDVKQSNAALIVISLTVASAAGQSVVEQRGEVARGRLNENTFIWRDPGAVTSLDLAAGPLGTEGAPKAPFTFVEEPASGTSPKVIVKDASNRTWVLKFGPEAKAETFATRMLWATGYYVEPSSYVTNGKLEKVGSLKRAAPFVDRSTGAFSGGRFELRDPKVEFLQGRNWSFADTLFSNTGQVAGLKIMMMLLSNWDVKDSRSSDGPNTGIVSVQKDDGSKEIWYMVSDWGASMGHWGGISNRSKWDCKGYAEESQGFIKGVDKNGKVGFSFKGKRAEDLTDGIKQADVQLLMGSLGRISDEQIQSALKASGANEQETACFAPAVRSRIDQLRQIAAGEKR